jgi:hypothetical protein
MREVVRRMIFNANAEDAVAEAIRAHERWGMDARSARHRLMGALRDHEGRHFDVEWTLIAVRECCRIAGPGVAAEVIGLFAEAQYEGRRLYEEMLTVVARDGRKQPLRAGESTGAQVGAKPRRIA